MRPSPSNTLLTVLQLFASTLHIKSVYTITSPCRDQCGTIPINYPFGVDDGCGATQYRKMLNCTSDLLFFLTPSGNYKVKAIDYQKQTITIFDPGMSTCTILQPHHDFIMSEAQSIVMPPTSDTVFALLNCSIDSPVLNHYSSVCFNFSGHSCDELYSSCTSFSIFHAGPVHPGGQVGPGGPIGPGMPGVPMGPGVPQGPTGLGVPVGQGAQVSTGGSGGYPPCCFTGYSTVKLLSMNILDCTHYTSIYDTDGLKGIGPLDWAYGIKMGYSVPNSGCERCQRSGGRCGFDTETEMMLCMCSTSSNSTRECAAGSVTDGCSKVLTSMLFLLCVLGFRAFTNVHL